MGRLPSTLKKQLTAVAKALQKLSVPKAGHAPLLKDARNIFLIRSATPELFKKAVGELRLLAPRATLHIVSHERDKDLIKSIGGRVVFYAYTAGGNYTWEALLPLQKKIAAAKPDTFVMLANNVYGYPHIAEILYRLGAHELHLFNTHERWLTLTRQELEFKTACAGVYQGVCNLFWEDVR